MNHADAATIREELNDLACVVAPDEDRRRGAFRLARVRQPGYLNQDPLYEVVLEAGREPVYLPQEFLDAVAGWECYVRVDGETVHVRDWSTEAREAVDGAEVDPDPDRETDSEEVDA